MHRKLSKVAALATATCLAAASCSGGGGGGGDDGPIKLRFQSLAWQKESIKANKALVKEWNASHPKIQVQYVQGDWGSAHDKLLTAFQGGDPPDIIHYEAAAGQVFAEGGYFADLDPLLSDDFKASIPDNIWKTVQYQDQGTVGVPFLMESRLPIANKKMLDAAGVRIPTPDNPWTWDEFQAAAKKLTKGDTYGVAWPLDSPANAVVTLSQNFGGTFVDDSGDRPAIDVGDDEMAVPTRIHDMLYKDKSAAPSAIGSNSTDALPGFFAGKYAMVFGAIWLRQQMVEQAPDDFDWVTIPPLQGTNGQAQATNPQTLSVAAQSEHPKAAAKFIQFFLQPKNMARLAMGDWLVPTSNGALEQLQKKTHGKQGWDVAAASADTLTAAPWRRTPGFQEWMDRIATPKLQQYFGNDIDSQQLVTQLEKGGEKTLGRHR